MRDDDTRLHTRLQNILDTHILSRDLLMGLPRGFSGAYVDEKREVGMIIINLRNRNQFAFFKVYQDYLEERRYSRR